MEISKVITLSTAHISKKTGDMIDADPVTNTLGLCIYPKADYGWFIVIDDNAIYQAKTESIPEDLARLILFANDIGCSYLCLDCDGEVIPYLYKYDWESEQNWESEHLLNQLKELSYKVEFDLTGDEEIEINNIDGCIWVCKYSPSKGCSEQVKLFCNSNEIDRNDIINLCDRNHWSYVL